MNRLTTKRQRENFEKGEALLEEYFEWLKTNSATPYFYTWCKQVYETKNYKNAMALNTRMRRHLEQKGSLSEIFPAKVKRAEAQPVEIKLEPEPLGRRAQLFEKYKGLRQSNG